MGLVLCSSEGHVGIVTLNRPEKLNTISRQMAKEISDTLQVLGSSPKTRVIIITGSEKAFSVGADLEELSMAGSSADGYAFSARYQRLCDLVEALPQPVIAAMSGFVMGAGFELALACDFRVASVSTVFALPEIKIGAFPAGGGTQRLARVIGTGRAKELIFTGRRVKTEEAFQLGLVSGVYPVSEYLEEAKKLAKEIVAQPRLGVQAAKKLINQSLDSDLRRGLELEAQTFSAISTTDDFCEGVSAFMDKRPPNFSQD